jgi:hypothetical protein
VALNTNFKGTQQFVLCGITLAQQCLKLHNMLPPNGIILGSGSTIVTNDGKEKKVFFIQLTIEVVEIPICVLMEHFKHDESYIFWWTIKSLFKYLGNLNLWDVNRALAKMNCQNRYYFIGS